MDLSAAGADLQSIEFQTRESCMQTLQAIRIQETYEDVEMDFELPITRIWCVDDVPTEAGGDYNRQRILR